MSFFKNLLARIGTGAMMIHTDFEKKPYKRGETVTGEIRVIGGRVPQKALSVLIYLMIEKEDGEIIPFGDYKVYASFEVKAGEKVTFPFVIELPEDGPYTTENEQVFLMTNVVKLLALDQRDKQYIHVIEK